MKPEIKLTTYPHIPGTVYWSVVDTTDEQHTYVAHGQEASEKDALDCASDALVAKGHPPCRPHEDDGRWTTRIQRIYRP